MFGLSLQRCSLMFMLAASVLSVPTSSKSSDAQKVVRGAQARYEKNTRALIHRSDSTCTPSTIAIRRAWDDLSFAERTEYIGAVQCMTKLPPATPSSLAPGVRSKFDDFVYAHINQTNYVHASALFLPWHRQFIWAFEQTLRDECGYTGSLPYWPWERHSANQSASPVFQAGPDSFGTNGVYVPHGDKNGSLVGIDPPFIFPIPAGTGGGAVPNGGLANLIINLGPVSSLATANTTPSLAAYGLNYNPRPLARDFFQPISTNSLTYAALASLYQTPDIHTFHPELLAIDGIHAASHAFIGADVVDFYSAPNDPVFYLLHAQVDRVWSVWQGLDYASRRDALDGTLTFFNRPPSDVGTLQSPMKMLAAGGDLVIADAMSTIAGEYCYMYA